MAKIVTLFRSKLGRHDKQHGGVVLIGNTYIRLFKISEALARRGHQVDIALPKAYWWQRCPTVEIGKNLRKVWIGNIKWEDYDVVKTLFHGGFQTLEKYGGTAHPFIISKLGSVVGPEDKEGVYFYGKWREGIYSVQEKINKTSKYITVLTRQSKELWEKCFGSKNNILLIPGAVDAQIPPPSGNPYPKKGIKICLFAGNIYEKDFQPEAHAVLVEKLNILGELLLKRGIWLCIIGSGDTRRINKRFVAHLGAVPYGKSWDYLYYANVGIVVALGKFPNDNESTKIYHYLRAGLPAVVESGFPNQDIVTEAGLGFIVENGNMELMAQKIEEAANREWDRDRAVKYILDNHTWDKRVEVYDKIIKEKFG